MALTVLEKQPSENFPIGMEFAGKLPDGVSLSSGTVTGRIVTTGATDNSIVQSTVATITGTQARVRVQSGTHGVVYKISFVVTLSDGSVLEEDLLMDVKDL